MSRELEKVREDEIDLVDLLKVIIVNKKVILGIWFIILMLGLFFGFNMKKNKSFEANRKFVIRTIISETELNNDPISLYEDQNFIDKMIGNELVRKQISGLEKLNENSKKESLKRIFNVNKENNSYSIKVSGKNINEIGRAHV